MRVPGTRSVSGTAVGLTDASENDTEGRDTEAGAALLAPEATAEPDTAAEPETAGDEAAAPLDWALAAAAETATVVRTASFMMGRTR